MYVSTPLMHTAARPIGAMRGLGDLASDTINFPYGKYSAQTLVIQNQLNAKLIQNGFCPIIADGKLGAATCGAATVIGGLLPGAMVLPPATCQDFKQPNSAANGCGTGPAVPAQSTSPQSSSAQATSASSGLFGGALGVGLLIGGAGVVAGLLYWARNRR